MEEPKQTMKTILRDRTYRTLLLATLLIVVMGLLRPTKVPGLYPKQYWALKTRWYHCADMVLLGDSRAFMGLSPAEMQKTLTNRRIYNYGFAGNAYSKQYLQAAYAILDPESKNPTVIMGVTPHSLTLNALKKNSFNQQTALPERELSLNIHLAGWINFFEPMSFRDALHGLFPSLKPTHNYMNYHLDGWVAGSCEPERIKDELRRLRREFTQSQVEPELVDKLLNTVRFWTAKGVVVYGFRPPTCVKMVELENELSGFDQPAFVAAFQDAGGTWIDTDQTAYHTHDGSHLHFEAALELSRFLAQAIQKHEQ
ncbi:MAG: hypothetical protein JXD22_03575 [Sedimentisphaerales bacterium]|nr:hypothetical protein [Sedimentisphaerales bacterium]